MVLARESWLFWRLSFEEKNESKREEEEDEDSMMMLRKGMGVIEQLKKQKRDAFHLPFYTRNQAIFIAMLMIINLRNESLPPSWSILNTINESNF